MINLVEMCEEGQWNQKCKHGHLIEGHAVYCHSDKPNAPRKCKHTWFWGKNEKGSQDEDCPLFELNPNYVSNK